jgi:hypothetical protein
MNAFNPELIRISNDSSKHAHHAAMRAQNGGSGESRTLLGTSHIVVRNADVHPRFLCSTRSTR